MMEYVVDLFFFFFFQAEDGIRDVAVTGVQTCALPISRPDREARARVYGSSARQGDRRRRDRLARPARHEDRHRPAYPESGLDELPVARPADAGAREAGDARQRRELRDLRSEEHTSELQSRLHL